MRALRLNKLAESAVVEQVDPATPRPGDVVVKVIAASPSREDVLAQNSTAVTGYTLSRTLGSHFAGEVVAIGSAVGHCKVGDLVVTAPVGSCGQCQPCLTGMDNYCISTSTGPTTRIGVDLDGGLADLAAVPARCVLPVGNVDPHDAAPASDAGLRAYHAIRVARTMLAPGNHAVVIGGNAVARYAMGILSHGLGCRVIAVTDDVELLTNRSSNPLAAILDLATADATAIRDLVGGFGADCILDFVATDASTALAASAATQGGAIVVAADSGASVAIGAGRLNRNGSARFVQGGSRGDLVELLDLLGTTPITVDHSTVSLDEFAQSGSQSDIQDAPVVVTL